VSNLFDRFDDPNRTRADFESSLLLFLDLARISPSAPSSDDLNHAATPDNLLVQNGTHAQPPQGYCESRLYIAVEK